MTEDPPPAGAPAGAPDFAEPLLGFRGWKIDKEGRLAPVTGGASWTHGVNRAVCMRLWPGQQKHQAPTEGCGCGFNAFHRPDMPELKRMSLYVVGAIAAWGNVDVYRDGFRAQFACVVALSYDGSTTIEQYRNLQRAAERYEVRLVEGPDLIAEGSRYASAVAPDTLPAPKVPKPIPPAPAKPGTAFKQRARRTRTARNRGATAKGTTSISSVAGPAPGRQVRGEDLPPWALRETGYRLRSHLGVSVRGLTADLCLTPAFLAVIGEATAVRFTAPGSKVLADDVVAAIHTDLGSFAVRAPFDGTVHEANVKAVATGGDPQLTAGEWFVRIKTTDASISAGTAVWGEDGWNSYRRYVSAREDTAIRRELALSADAPPAPVNDGRPDLSTSEGVRWLAEVLDPQLAMDVALQSALAERELEMSFWVPALSAGIVVQMQRPDRPTITFTDKQPDARLGLILGADALQEYWTGELDLAAALQERVTLIGSRDEALRATALMRRLCPTHLERITSIREAGRLGSRALAKPAVQRRRAA